VKCFWFSQLLVFAWTLALPAQELPITPGSPVSHDTLQTWLHSGDPRLIAWAADFARSRHDEKVVAEMPALLEHWTLPPQLQKDKAQEAQDRAIQAVLDTLIQENVLVSIAAINAVAPNYPAQAAVLISRLPLSESHTTLVDWSYGTTGTWSAGTLVRIASMMLAKNPAPDPSFVARVVAASEEELRIRIGTSNSNFGVTVGGPCVDYFPRELPQGWPQVYGYDLVENYERTSALPVVDLNGDSISSRRFEENRHPGSCYTVRELTPSTRHKLIAHWLGIPDKEMSWQPVQVFTIVWTNKAEYQRQLGEVVDAERVKLRATVETLRERGFLGEGEAPNLPPRLLVTVQCGINPCPLD
jgi:hypothetical protein